MNKENNLTKMSVPTQNTLETTHTSLYTDATLILHMKPVVSPG